MFTLTSRGFALARILIASAFARQTGA